MADERRMSAPTPEARPGAFILDFDGKANASSPEAQAAAAGRSANPEAETLSDEEYDALIAGNALPDESGRQDEDEIEGGEGAEKPEASASDEAPGDDLKTQVQNLTAGLNQLAGMVAAQLKQPEPPGGAEDSPEAMALEALQRANPSLDEAGVRWLYENNRAVIDAVTKPLVSRLDNLEKRSETATHRDSVKEFYRQLDTCIASEGVTGEDSVETIREIVEARFMKNPNLTMDKLPAVVKAVKGRVLKSAQAETEEIVEEGKRRGKMPPTNARGGQAGVEDLHAKAVKSSRKEADFGGKLSRSIATQILQRVSLNE